MSVISFNNVLADNITMELPRTGQWSASLTFINLTTEELRKLTVNTKSSIVIDKQKWVGTIASANTIPGEPETYVTVLGGTGKMRNVTKAKNLNNISAQQATEDIIASNAKVKQVQSSTKESATYKDNNSFKEPDIQDAGSTSLLQNLLPFDINEIKEDAKRTDLLGDIAKAALKVIQNTDVTHAQVAKAMGNTKQDKFQTLDNVSSGQQLSKTIKIKTNNQDADWRIDNNGELIYVIDSDPTVLTPRPTEVGLFKTNSHYLKYQAFELDYVYMPGTWIQDPTNNSTWRIEHIQIMASTREAIITLYKKSIRSALKTLTKDIDDFNKNYSGTVNSQNSDGTINLLPDDNLIKGGGISNIPIRGPVGSKQTIIEGTRAIVQYENNDPSRPYIVGFYEMDNSQHSNSNVYITYGNTSTAQLVALSNLVDTEIQRIWTHLTTTFPVLATDGGATLQTNSITAANAAKLQIQSCASKRIKSD